MVGVIELDDVNRRLGQRPISAPGHCPDLGAGEGIDLLDSAVGHRQDRGGAREDRGAHNF